MTTTLTEQAIPTGTWTLDATHSQVGYAVKHAGVSLFRGGLETAARPYARAAVAHCCLESVDCQQMGDADPGEVTLARGQHGNPDGEVQVRQFGQRAPCERGDSDDRRASGRGGLGDTDS